MGYSGTSKPHSPLLSYLFRYFGNKYKAIIVDEEAVQDLQRWKRSNIKDYFFPLLVVRMEQCGVVMMSHLHAKPHSSAAMSLTQFLSLSASIWRY